ncbi:hypothetical protein D3C73_840620 [compost metagenome]
MYIKSYLVMKKAICIKKISIRAICSIFLFVWIAGCSQQKYTMYNNTTINIGKSYFNLSRQQTKAIELYLMAKSQFSGIRDFPNIVGIDKVGDITPFDQYKTRYEDCLKDNCMWEVNLFHIEFLRADKNGTSLSFTLLEPAWNQAAEVQYEGMKRYATNDEIELFKSEMPIRYIRKVIQKRQFNRKYLFYYLNDYGK